MRSGKPVCRHSGYPPRLAEHGDPEFRVELSEGESAVFALDYLRDRFAHTLDASVAARLTAWLNELQSAVIDDDLDASAEAAEELRAVLAGL